MWKWTEFGALSAGFGVALGTFALAGIAIFFVAALAHRSRGEPTWKEIRTVTELRQRFNRDQGSIRIVLLLSPT